LDRLARLFSSRVSPAKVVTVADDSGRLSAHFKDWNEFAVWCQQQIIGLAPMIGADEHGFADNRHAKSTVLALARYLAEIGLGEYVSQMDLAYLSNTRRVVGELARCKAMAIRLSGRPDRPSPQQTNPHGVDRSDIDLTSAEKAIVDAIGDSTILGNQLAEKLAIPNNSAFRGKLSQLVKRDILENVKRKGYRRKE
jgi:hypothetical protein